MHEYITAHWAELFPENPNRSDLCLKLGYSVLTIPLDELRLNITCWHWIICAMREPEELEHVVSLLSTPAARAALVKDYPELAPFVHDPLLVACYCRHINVMAYMMRTAPPDVQRFNEALRICRHETLDRILVSYAEEKCIQSINARPDMQVHSDGVVVAVDPDGSNGNSSEFLLYQLL